MAFIQYKLLFILLLLFSCRSSKHQHEIEYRNGIPVIKFCDLPNFEGKLVYIQAIYSGIDEYWSLNSTKKCKSTKNVELDYYKDGKQIAPKYKLYFDSAYSSYWNTYLKVGLTGIYESKNSKGYGHLSSNKSRFILNDIVEVTLIKRN
jgi:hypothetical protein